MQNDLMRSIAIKEGRGLLISKRTINPALQHVWEWEPAVLELGSRSRPGQPRCTCNIQSLLNKYITVFWCNCTETDMGSYAMNG